MYNPLYIDPFTRASLSSTYFASSTTIEPIDMSKNRERNVWKQLSDYARLLFQGLITCVHAPLNRSVDFQINSHIMSILSIFHVKDFEIFKIYENFGIVSSLSCLLRIYNL